MITDDKVSIGYFIPLINKLSIAICSDKEQQYEIYATQAIDPQITANFPKRNSASFHLFSNRATVNKQPPRQRETIGFEMTQSTRVIIPTRSNLPTHLKKEKAFT